MRTKVIVTVMVSMIVAGLCLSLAADDKSKKSQRRVSAAVEPSQAANAVYRTRPDDVVPLCLAQAAVSVDKSKFTGVPNPSDKVNRLDPKLLESRQAQPRASTATGIWDRRSTIDARFEGRSVEATTKTRITREEP